MGRWKGCITYPRDLRAAKLFLLSTYRAATYRYRRRIGVLSLFSFASRCAGQLGPYTHERRLAKCLQLSIPVASYYKPMESIHGMSTIVENAIMLLEVD